MRLTRVYSPEPLVSGNHLKLPKDLYHYLANVLRLKAGDTVALFNAVHGEFHAVITDVKKNAMTVTLGEQQRKAALPDLVVYIGCVQMTAATAQSWRLQFRVVFILNLEDAQS